MSKTKRGHAQSVTFKMAGIPITPPIHAVIAAKRKASYDFEFYPQLWRDRKSSAYYRHRKWHHVFFKIANQQFLPAKPGIYMFVVAPRHAHLRDHTYIFYVGQTDNIQRRFGEYFGEMRGIDIDDRERIVDFLNYFEGHIFFNYTQVPQNELDDAENYLVDRIKPWANVRTRIKGLLASPIPI